ncbi:lipopolysaccharide biosynthesis protein [Hymenobacter weizhouensis]|uniref:lipopolysaccharide biosynthesis protein n=1 Tax=Hymenobacter sp. YIM 151500-1 TaxID=2987689 RepID=UPI002225C90A|nr:polysaccharide biosynthesis C-terminal domain-containing protein [Hymenobacter sp. YIM 151500-1]UYZ62727.1 polysaccharide biosynthesis C-terminal domain-containing protein [Hymenobacter sp. YIM 151500-1]
MPLPSLVLQRILHNFAARLATALLNFGVVWLTARYLGAAGRGAVSLFVTDCALLLLFIGLLGGSSLIYLAPRRNVWHLLLPAYGWATLVCLAGAGLLAQVRAAPPAYWLHLAALALLQALFSINTSLLLGRRQERLYNALTVTHVGLLALLLGAAFTGGHASVAVYFQAAYVAYGLPLLASSVALLRLPDPRRRRWRRLRATARELARHSRGAHLSNLLTFINYRLSYYFVAHYADAQAVGVLSVGVALAEAVWLIPRSTALVQYVELVHNAGQGRPQLAAARLTLLGTGAAVLGLVALPPAVLGGVFGPEFAAARPVLLLLAPGVLLVTVQMLCSSYFAGRAHYRINNLAALVGLLVTVPACWLLIPRLGIRGAAAASSLSYLASAGFLFFHFRRATGAGVRALLPRPADLAPLRQLLPVRPK